MREHGRRASVRRAKAVATADRRGCPRTERTRQTDVSSGEPQVRGWPRTSRCRRDGWARPSTRATYAAVYVVLRFAPFDLRTFFASPSLRTRGISFAAMPRRSRICSARSPPVSDFTSATTFARARAISAGDLRASRPGLVVFVAGAGAFSADVVFLAGAAFFAADAFLVDAS